MVDVMTKLRRRTRLIIRKDHEWLVGGEKLSFLRMSISPYDAWQTISLYDARKVAEKIGGEIYMFNPIVGELRKLEVRSAGD